MAENVLFVRPVAMRRHRALGSDSGERECHKTTPCPQSRRKMKIIVDALALAGREDGPQRQLTSNHRQNNKEIICFISFK